MIKISINNQRAIEVSQEVKDGNINVDVINSDGSLDYTYKIKAEDFLMLLNQYQLENNII